MTGQLDRELLSDGGAYSALKGAFADLSRGFFRVVGIAKTTVLLDFTLAAYNLDRIRSFKAKHGLDDNGQAVPTPKQTRARRRSGAWTEVIETSQAPPTDVSTEQSPINKPTFFRSASARLGPGQDRHANDSGVGAASRASRMAGTPVRCARGATPGDFHEHRALPFGDTPKRVVHGTF
ncbi:MAG: hypothetical protein JWL57_921 [Actinobacteria bacterium]|nr:hypothetical protein [Actinomycetota bacterium]